MQDHNTEHASYDTRKSINMTEVKNPIDDSLSDEVTLDSEVLFNGLDQIK